MFEIFKIIFKFENNLQTNTTNANNCMNSYLYEHLYIRLSLFFFYYNYYIYIIIKLIIISDLI